MSQYIPYIEQISLWPQLGFEELVKSEFENLIVHYHAPPHVEHRLRYYVLTGIPLIVEEKEIDEIQRNVLVDHRLRRKLMEYLR